MSRVFSPQKRINRAAFFRKYIQLFLLLLMISFMSTIIFSWGFDPWDYNKPGQEIIAAIQILILCLIIIWVLAMQIFYIIGRFHDLEMSGVNIFLLLIPLFNIIVLLYLFFKEGTIGPNKYGEDPLVRGES